MTLGDEILTILFNYSGGYKLMRQKLRGSSYLSRKGKSEINPRTLYTTLARLEKHGLVKKDRKIWEITRRGKKFLGQKLSTALPFYHPTPKRTNVKVNKNLVIVFDVPEKCRQKRDWLRTELVLLNFSPLQKSVWLGPSPLPEEFVKILNQLNILQYVKFFEAKETEII